MISTQILLVILGFLALTACVPTNTALSGLATPIPPYVATDQASALQARSTVQAGQAQAAELAVRSTQVAMNLTEAAATESAFVRQTQRAITATANAQALAAIATQGQREANATATRETYEVTATAEAWQVTRSAQAVLSTQSAHDQNIRATSTQFALNELERQDQIQAQTLQLRAWSMPTGLLLVGILVVVLTLKSWPVILTRLGVVRWGPNGKPYFTFHTDDGGIAVVDMGRSNGPALKIEPTGQLAAPIQVTDQVIGRAQAGELMLAANTFPHASPEHRRQAMQQALKAGASPQPTQALPAGEIIDAEIQVLPANDVRVRPILDEIEPRLLSEHNGQG